MNTDILAGLSLRAMGILLAGVLAAGLAVWETVEFKALTPGVLEERLKLAHPKSAERFLRLRGLFTETGCKDLREQKVKGSREPNLICAVETNAPDARRIIVGAHFDSGGGTGIIDNWTGAILLPSLAEFIAEKPRRHSFHFVGFAAEEKGLVGSQAYLKSMTDEERNQIAAVVTMDSLGLTATKWWPSSSSKELVVRAYMLAQALKLDFAGVNVDGVGSTDSWTFHQAGTQHSASTRSPRRRGRSSTPPATSANRSPGATTTTLTV